VGVRGALKSLETTMEQGNGFSPSLGYRLRLKGEATIIA